MIEWLARRIWGGMLWFIRRPAIRRLQRASLMLVPESRRERAHQSMIAQERLARRIGLPTLRFVLRLLFFSIFMTLFLSWFLDAVDSGRVVIPTREVIEAERRQVR